MAFSSDTRRLARPKFVGCRNKETEKRLRPGMMGQSRKERLLATGILVSGDENLKRHNQNVPQLR